MPTMKLQKEQWSRSTYSIHRANNHHLGRISSSFRIQDNWLNPWRNSFSVEKVNMFDVHHQPSWILGTLEVVSITWQLCPTPKIWLEWTFWLLLKELASAKPAKLLLESSPQKEYLCLQGLQNNHQTGEVYLTFISLDIHLQDNSGWGYGGKKVLKRDGIHPFLRTRPRLLFWPC